MVKDLIEKIGRWLWRRDANEGQMVGDYKEHETHWRKESKKIIKIIENHKKRYVEFPATKINYVKGKKYTKRIKVVFKKKR